MGKAGTAVLLCLIFATVQMMPWSDEWNSFKVKYNKFYKTEEEENNRYKIFLENKKSVDAHNEKYDEGLETYLMGINEFSDMTSEEFEEFMPEINFTSVDSDAKLFTSFKYSTVNLPDYVNWVEQGAVTHVKYQGACGSCWAFSATGAIESHLFIKTGRLVSLSEQNLLDCSDQFGNKGCTGGLPAISFRYVKENDGIDTFESYPYSAKKGKCQYNPQTRATTVKGFVKLPGGNEQALQSAVATVGPVTVTLKTVKSFRKYVSGIYTDSSCTDGSGGAKGHSLLVVGYGTEDGQDYWLLKNSWGSKWGNKGYIKVARNLGNLCKITSAAVYPLL